MSFSNQKSFEAVSERTKQRNISLRAALLVQLDALMQDHANELRGNGKTIPEHLFSTDTLTGAGSMTPARLA